MYRTLVNQHLRNNTSINVKRREKEREKIFQIFSDLIYYVRVDIKL